MNNRLPLIVSAVLGLVAVLLIFFWARNYRESFAVKKVTVLAAKVDIRPGDSLGTHNMKKKYVPEEFLPNAYIPVEDVNLVAGETVKHPLSADKPILWTDLHIEQVEGLAEAVRRDERAITIPVNDVTGVGGLIKPRDHVDLIGTFETEDYDEMAKRGGPSRGMMNVPVNTATITLLQNVTVLATGRSLSEGVSGLARTGQGYNNVTLLVTPEEAQMLVFCLKRGDISLSLRNPEDFTIQEELQKTTDEAIMNQLWPNRLTKERRIRMQIYERGVEVK